MCIAEGAADKCNRRPDTRMKSFLLTCTLALLWYERSRFLAAILAVACSAALISLQWALLLGVFTATSIPIDHSRADVWLAGAGVRSVDEGRPISDTHRSRLAVQPEVESTELCILDYASWIKPDSSRDLCMVVASELTGDAVGPVRELTLELRRRLAEPGSVVASAGDLERLGIAGVGAIGEISGHRVRVVGLVEGLKGLNAPYLFCSLDTGRHLLGYLPGQTTYVVARCRPSADLGALTQRLHSYADLSVYTREDFALQTRTRWLFKSNGGSISLFTAGLALLVGLAITSQTLYAATLGSLREYATLRALGIPAWRIGTYVLAQAGGVGVLGVILAIPLTLVLMYCAEALGIPMGLPWWLRLTVVGVTVLMALVAGLATLRTLRLMDPNTLLYGAP